MILKKDYSFTKIDKELYPSECTIMRILSKKKGDSDSINNDCQLLLVEIQSKLWLTLSVIEAEKYFVGLVEKFQLNILNVKVLMTVKDTQSDFTQFKRKMKSLQQLIVTGW